MSGLDNSQVVTDEQSLEEGGIAAKAHALEASGELPPEADITLPTHEAPAPGAS